MEPQKEARTRRDPEAQPLEASRSHTPNEEERGEGGAALASAAVGSEADRASADGLWELPVEPAQRRPECSSCSRPQKVCLCPFLPLHPLHISTHLYIIQHPAEESKVLRTVPLLAACLPQDKCKVKIGRRFSEEKDPELSAICRKSDTLILYPGAEAANLEEFLLDSSVYPSTIIIIDGTWSQAKDIFYKNSLFRLPKQAFLSSSTVVRSRCMDAEVGICSAFLLEEAFLEDDQQQHSGVCYKYRISDLTLLELHSLCFSKILRVAHFALDVLEFLFKKTRQFFITMPVTPREETYWFLSTLAHLYIDSSVKGKLNGISADLGKYPKHMVQLKTSISSQYVIRTQPTNRCLSTLECAAVALSILEKNNSIQETLLRPLQALCSFQLQHGAQIRLSKEHLLKNGLYPKPMPKNKRKLRKMELLMNSVKI